MKESVLAHQDFTFKEGREDEDDDNDDTDHIGGKGKSLMKDVIDKRKSLQ